MNNKLHNYDYDVDVESSSAPANVIRIVGSFKRVLEIGSGPGSITKVLAKDNFCKITALEVDKEAIKLVTPYCEAVFQADLNSPEWPDLLTNLEKFDVVVAADVLEHLYDPWNTLKRMTNLINENGYIVVSLPHVGHVAVMACILNGDFEYRDWGLLDRTHIRFFGLKNIDDLFKQAGLKIIEIRYVNKSIEDTEFFDQWNKLPLVLKKALANVSGADLYQVVIKAVPENHPGQSVILKAPKGEFKTLSYQSLLALLVKSTKKYLGKYLSKNLKHRIRYFLKILRKNKNE